MLWLKWGLNNFVIIRDYYFFKSWEFVCLHRSLSTLSQSHKFRSRCPTLTRSQSLSLGIFKGWSRRVGVPIFLNHGVGVRVPQKMRTPHPCFSGSRDISYAHKKATDRRRQNRTLRSSLRAVKNENARTTQLIRLTRTSKNANTLHISSTAFHARAKQDVHYMKTINAKQRLQQVLYIKVPHCKSRLSRMFVRVMVKTSRHSKAKHYTCTCGKT